MKRTYSITTSRFYLHTPMNRYGEELLPRREMDWEEMRFYRSVFMTIRDSDNKAYLTLRFNDRREAHRLVQEMNAENFSEAILGIGI